MQVYLRRLGLSRSGPPSVEDLFRLHAAHVERVAYEALDIQLGRVLSIDPSDSATRIARGRGGYCYHLNGALSWLLSHLGYQVTRHFGGVQNAPGDPPGANGNHLVLTVSGLPSRANPAGRWLVDAGLGDALHEPLPLLSGTHRQGPFVYGLRPSSAEPGGWRFDHDPAGSFTGMDFRSAVADMSEFAAMHVRLSTSPESGFVRVGIVQRRDATGIDTLRGLVLSRVPGSRATMESPAEYFDALADVFGLTLDPGDRDPLWRRLVSAHERYIGARP